MGIRPHYLKNVDGTKFYPFAHADATFDRNGEKVGDVLDNLDTKIGDIEKNTIAGIQQNGEDLNIDEETRKVNINVPTKLSELEQDVSFAPSEGSVYVDLQNSEDADEILLVNADTLGGHEVDYFATAESLTAKETELKDYADTKSLETLEETKKYTDTEIANLTNGAISVGNSENSNNLGNQPPSYYATAKSVEDIVTGATSVGNAENSAKLGNETAEKWQEKLDEIQSTSRGNLSQVGWYRVAETTGGHNGSLFLRIGNLYNTGGCEEHTLFFNNSHNNIEFIPFSCKSTLARVFTKVRYTRDSGKRYLEVYYALDVNNLCVFSVFGQDSTGSGFFKSITPTLTSETVEGVTVTAEYNIPSNASPVTDLDLQNFDADTVDGLHANQLMRSSLGYGTNIFGSYNLNDWTLPGAYSVEGSCLNFPPELNDAWGDLLVLGGVETQSTQLFVPWNYSNRVYIRRKYNDLWNDWIRLTTTADLTTALAKYLPNTGGTIYNPQAGSSPLGVEVDNELSYINFKSKKLGGLMGLLGFNGKDNPVYATSDGSTSHKLLHTGNKPSGSYTGNGANRTIQVGGIGSALKITGNSISVVVTDGGAFGIDVANNNFIGGGITFKDGVLTLTAGSKLNVSGVTYYYQVL